MDPKTKILAYLTRRRSASGGELREHLRLSRQALSVHFQALLRAGKVLRTGTTRGARYMLASHASQPVVLRRALALKSSNEDLIWDDVEARLQLARTLRPNVMAIARYAFTEMLNNAIEHSKSARGALRVELGTSSLTFEIRDHGIGAFHSIASKLHLPDEEAALIELVKGKTTTMPEAHAGEGIFFTSRVGDSFLLKSHRITVEWKRAPHDVFISQTRFLVGTLVQFSVSRNARQKLEDVFQEFAPPEYDFQFQKTRVLVKLLRKDYVSRSEARRLLTNLEKFREIAIDFRDVHSVGQGFADEVFRVFVNRNPSIIVRSENAPPAVQAMIRHVQRDAPTHGT